MEKSFTIKTSSKDINPEFVAASFGSRTGMGFFKDYELWEIRKTFSIGNKDTRDYFLAVKGNVCLVENTLTEILNFIYDELTVKEN